MNAKHDIFGLVGKLTSIYEVFTDGWDDLTSIRPQTREASMKEVGADLGGIVRILTGFESTN